MSEIVVADPIDDEQNPSSRRPNTAAHSQQFTRSLTSGRENIPEIFDSEILPVTLAPEVQRFLRVANLIQIDEPRVAYICRFHAFEVAHQLDRTSCGRGVRQFKSFLLRRLEQDDDLTAMKRKEYCDFCELWRVYHQYKDYIIKHGADYTLANRDMSMKACAVASVLFEVLNANTSTPDSQAPVDILPLDQGGVNHAIMQLPEV